MNLVQKLFLNLENIRAHQNKIRAHHKEEIPDQKTNCLISIIIFLKAIEEVQNNDIAQFLSSIQISCFT